MRKEGDFSSVITLEKSKTQKTKKNRAQLSKNRAQLSKNLREKKKCSFVEIWVLRKTPQTGSFLEEKNLKFQPQLFISKKKKNFENEKKVERKTEIFFFSQNEFFCGFQQNHDFMIS